MRNTLLALAQAEDREHKEFVGVLNSFFNWRKQNIQVLKGSKAYKIFAPIFTKKKIEEKPAQEEDTEEKILSFFKLANTFDISQTSEFENYIKEQKEIDEKIMKNHEIDYSTAIDFAKKQFPKIPIVEEFRHQEKKGSYDPHTRQITLYERSSHTLFHEIGHLITIDILKIAGDIRKDYASNEVLAEVSAYLLMKTFSESIDYNFAYSNCWSSKITDTFEIGEFEKDFKTITHYLEQFSTTKPKGESEAKDGI